MALTYRDVWINTARDRPVERNSWITLLLLDATAERTLKAVGKCEAAFEKAVRRGETPATSGQPTISQ